ncbi:MAG: LuxR C-terminal-related transcriptional regulator, partial [Brooklawnia sp.]
AVVMLTVSEDSDDLLEALQAGARGYILKDVPARQLKNYLRDIRDGHSVVSPSMAGVLFNRAGPDDYGAENSDLSERQKQVVRLVAEGDSNYQIARKLGLSENTVKKYVHLIMTKLGAANRAEAAVRAFRDGLLDE